MIYVIYIAVGFITSKIVTAKPRANKILNKTGSCCFHVKMKIPLKGFGLVFRLETSEALYLDNSSYKNLE